MKTIKQTVTIKRNPHDVYEALMDSHKHTRFTGDKAVISKTIGGTFSVFDGYAQGTNLELIPDKKIVQTWRASDWPEGHSSMVTFMFKAVPSGTRLTFTQTDVPDEFADDIAQGWKDYYWTPLKQMLERT